MRTFQQRMEQYAALAVEVGVNVQPGQKLCVIAPIAAAEFVREIVKHAYRIGSTYVHVDWSDEDVTRARLEHSPEAGLSVYPTWIADGRVQMAEDGAAFLWVDAGDPDLLNGIDAVRIGTMTKAQQNALQAFRKYTLNNECAWSIVAVPTQAWANKVFPEQAEAERVQALWEAIFAAVRVDAEDPVAAWRGHADNLRAKAGRLNEQKYSELRYRSASTGTDVTIGLPEGHVWVSAGTQSKQGSTFIPNMPTEEVFTSPHRMRINGKVVSSKPLSYNGNLIDRFSITFAEGRISAFAAEQGEDALRQLIETDDGSHYLGEIALVPYHSPISDTNVTFYNTLFDENAACHLAIGFAFPFCLEGGLQLSKEEQSARGLNQSLAHVDFMIGTADLEIDGVREDGSLDPVFRNGNWAF
ncbi:aminopeptidase [Paenibacillus sacheonensis]|uniref:Aminopeptidase n=1 Tax=Paenibacillus sacheonensis TaxID=742054 RepID=A0A7X4YMA1_9BACL|nr:aminopeptidase [Paenibacillus sacheonensis]MBM7563451.1 aminopeptidase [Paenibacillus sacheonensis]NBC67994.1 aminopeptidase [Paenibacillus sacheonensis]